MTLIRYLIKLDEDKITRISSFIRKCSLQIKDLVYFATN